MRRKLLDSCPQRTDSAPVSDESGLFTIVVVFSIMLVAGTIIVWPPPLPASAVAGHRHQRCHNRQDHHRRHEGDDGGGASVGGGHVVGAPGTMRSAWPHDRHFSARRSRDSCLILASATLFWQSLA